MFIKLCKYQQTTYIMCKKGTSFRAVKPVSEINYKDYPEFMFAIVAAYLSPEEGDDLRRVAGKVAFRHDRDGCTYKNGVLHTYNDIPAYTRGKYQAWYRDGKLHREGDRPALINGDLKQWYNDGLIQPILTETLLVNGIRMDVFTEMGIILLMFRGIVLWSGTRTDYYIGKWVPLLLIEVVRNGTRMENVNNT